MTDKHFKAILAKNDIAKAIREGEFGRELGTTVVSTAYVLEALKQIEQYIGEGNQPSVTNIYDSEDL